MTRFYDEWVAEQLAVRDLEDDPDRLVDPDPPTCDCGADAPSEGELCESCAAERFRCAGCGDVLPDDADGWFCGPECQPW